MTDSFEIYLHAKVLRLMIETNMRFGKDNVVIYLIEYANGKEKLIQTELIEIFGDKDSQGLYGTKDEIDDAEDFFPQPLGGGLLVAISLPLVCLFF